MNSHILHYIDIALDHMRLYEHQLQIGFELKFDIHISPRFDFSNNNKNPRKLHMVASGRVSMDSLVVHDFNFQKHIYIVSNTINT